MAKNGGRISEDELARLKASVSLEAMVKAAGVSLSRRGSDLVGCCPFHEDKTPSFSVTPDKGLWRCFGACDAGGDVITFLMKCERVSFRHAVELLRSQAGAMPPSDDGLAEVKPKPALIPLAAPLEDAALLGRVSDYYHDCLKRTPEALAYLSKRGIDPARVVDTFSLGFADRSLCYVLSGPKMRARLQGLGVLRETGHEHLRGSLVIPITDQTGSVVNLYGRKIRDDLRKGTPSHLYLPGPHRGVFNLDGVKGCAPENGKEVILCEALIDALTVYAAGFHHVTSAYGAGGFTDDILQAFVRHGVKRVLIAFDRDAAGDKGAVKVAQILHAHGIEAYRVRLPLGMDANAYALSVADAAEALGDMFRSAVWMDMAGPALTPPTPALEAGPATPSPVEPSLASPDPDPAPRAQPTASPVPAGLEALPALEMAQGLGEITLKLGERQWRVRGVEKNTTTESLKINLMVRYGDGFHVDGLDLLSAKARGSYIAEASNELSLPPEVIKRDLGQVLLRLEALQDERLKATAPGKADVTMTADEEAAALAFLKSPDLLEHIAADVAACGVVGEACNVQAVYLAALSRKLDKPLAVLIQSTSAAGKSALMDAVLNLVPEEERVAYSAMTGQSLFYLGEADLKHKALAIAEEEGVRQAAYALKLLQSQGSLTIASTGKDPATGKLVTQEYRVEGPVALMLTTTAIDLDEELRNRCLVLSVDESRDQTQAIHARQRFEETLEGLSAREDEHSLIALHRNAQRLLKPVKVVNPYAESLTFRDDQTRTRRDHRKYLGLIRAIALLHQHQRPQKTLKRPDGSEVAYIEVTVSDIAAANRLAHAVLGSTLDELPPQTRRLLTLIREMVTARAEAEGVAVRDVRFTRKDIRDHSGFGDTQAKVHLARLLEMEYLFVSRVRHTDQASAYAYELAWSGEGVDGAPFVMGLIDPATLYDTNRSGAASEQAGYGRGGVGALSGVSRGVGNPVKAMQDKALHDASEFTAENARSRTEKAPVIIVPTKVHLNGAALAG